MTAVLNQKAAESHEGKHLLLVIKLAGRSESVLHLWILRSTLCYNTPKKQSGTLQVKCFDR